MERKFTPWRMTYIKGDAATKLEGCVLCALYHGSGVHDHNNLVLYRGQHCYVVLNLYPYNTGHVMVVPYCHSADLPKLDHHDATELFELSRCCVRVLGEEYQPHGFNMGMNLGHVAGAGIAEHVHMHIVPRWNGDTNFMPVIGETKLIPEALEQTYTRLRPYFEHLA